MIEALAVPVLPDARSIQALVDAADVSDLLLLAEDRVIEQARWHLDQMKASYEGVIWHAVEAGRRIRVIKMSRPRGEWQPVVRDELGIGERQAERLMYLANNPTHVSEIVTRRPDVSIRAAIEELAAAVRIEKHADTPKLLAPTRDLPGDVFLDVANAAALPINDGLVDLIVTSPPYRLGKEYGAHVNDSGVYPDYLTDAREWADEMYRVAADHGRLCLNVPLDTTLGGVIHHLYRDWMNLLEAAGWELRPSVIWWEGNVTRSVARGSVDSPNAPYVSAPVEMVILAHKGAWNVGRADVAPDITHDEYLAWTGPAGGLWTFPGEARPWAGHPAAFPEELPRRLIRLFSYPSDVVLDPFTGSGTTAVVAHRLGRVVYGFDLAEQWVEATRARLAEQP